MGLRQQAETDLAFILEDEVSGFGWPIKITNPKGLSANLTALVNDIAQVIDPDTGIAVSGRLASATIRISSLLAVGMTIPKGISDGNLKPWIIEYNDINGTPFKFKVQQSNPDRTIGTVTCVLEEYR